MPVRVEPVANGLRTDHPVPNLPFVDDSHLPIENPEAVEALGRHAGTDMWGRYDHDDNGEWAAYTTDPKNHAFAWLLRFHPEHGLSIQLFRDENIASAYDWFGDRALLIRLGGYWWNGTTWYRPQQVLNWASETYMRRPVRLPTTITADDLLDDTCKPELGSIFKVTQFDASPGAVPPQQWRHDLAAWAERRPDGARDRARSVVSLNAPELADSSLLGVDEFASEAGIAASTLRAYIARGEGGVPLPQTSDRGRKRWSRPVVQDWTEHRKREPHNVASALTGDTENDLAPGLRRLWSRISEALMTELWGRPSSRRFWSRPHRNESAVRAIAEQGGWIAALNAEAAIPFDDLAYVVQDAVLWELRNQPEHAIRDGHITLSRQTGGVLGWFFEHKPERAPGILGGIVQQAAKLGASQETITTSLKSAVRDASEISADRLDEFFDVVTPPRA